MSSGVIVRPAHLREAKICFNGARPWFARRGWDWAEFVANGRPVEDFEQTGDHFAAQVAVIARKEAADDGR